MAYCTEQTFACYMALSFVWG